MGWMGMNVIMVGELHGVGSGSITVGNFHHDYDVARLSPVHLSVWNFLTPMIGTIIMNIDTRFLV